MLDVYSHLDTKIYMSCVNGKGIWVELWRMSVLLCKELYFPCARKMLQLGVLGWDLWLPGDKTLGSLLELHGPLTKLFCCVS